LNIRDVVDLENNISSSYKKCPWLRRTIFQIYDNKLLVHTTGIIVAMKIKKRTTNAIKHIETDK